MSDNSADFAIKINDAAIAMKMASMDYDDNSGGENADIFWGVFEEKRRKYLKLVKEQDQ